MMTKSKNDFQHNMTKNQVVLGWCYLPVHMFVLPILLPLLLAYSSVGSDELTLNLIYYAIGLLFTFTVMMKYLRRDFDSLLDRPLVSVLAMIQGYFINLLLSYAVVLVMELLMSSIDNPNNSLVGELAQQNSGTMFGLAVFIGPIVEETIFRGTVFGSIRKKSRAAAYIVSMLLFSVYHVWQYALTYMDASLFIYVIQYLPVSFALAWIYERTNSIWASIFFHMASNAISLAAMQMLERIM